MPYKHCEYDSVSRFKKTDHLSNAKQTVIDIRHSHTNPWRSTDIICCVLGKLIEQNEFDAFTVEMNHQLPLIIFISLPYFIILTGWEHTLVLAYLLELSKI